MKIVRWAVASAIALLAGCAGTADCADWFATGQNEGILAAPMSPERHAARCGGAIDAAAYEAGYHDGLSRRGRVSAF